MKTIHSQGKSSDQRGVVLVIALLLLIVIGFSSSYVLRNALFGDLLSHNLSSGQVAQQAAEVALNYCNNQVINPGTPIPPIQPSTDGEPDLWKSAKTWSNDAMAITIPIALLQPTNKTTFGVATYSKLPQCVFQFANLVNVEGKASNVAAKPIAIWVTVRGYSPDYQAATSGVAAAGSEVMLQSIVRMNSCPLAFANLPDCS